MANKTPVKAIFSGSDVTSLGEFASGDTIAVSYIADGTITAAKVAADVATQAELDTVSAVASAALPKAGGTMTGNIVMGDDTSIGISDSAERIEFDGAGDIGFLGCNVGIGTTTVSSPENNTGPILQIGDGSNAMASIVLHEDGNKWEVVSNSDLIIQDESVVRMRIAQAGDITFSDASQATKVTIQNAGKVLINNSAATGTSTGNANSSTETLNLDSKQNHVLTLGTNITLANPTTETVGQSGFIAFIQDGTGSRTVSLGTDWETAGAAGLTLTATAGATDLVPYVVVAANRILLGTPQLAFA
jgi:hypothetical protein